MKKLRVIQAVLILFSALAITSCGEDITLDPAGGGQYTDADLRVSFNNGAFVADEVTANVAGGAITWTATNEEGEMFTMTLNETALSLSNPPAAIHAYNDVSMTYMESIDGNEYVNVNPETGETSGSIVITEVDLANRTISGYFAFVGYNPDDAAPQPMPFYSGSFNNVVYTGDALPTPVPVVPTEPEGQYLRATIDGTEVEFGMVSAMPASGKLVLTGGTVSPLTSLNITVDETIEPGTYSFATSPVDGPYGEYVVGSTTHVSQEGTLQIITNSDGVIKGNFSFTALGGEDVTVEVMEGEFNMNVN